MNASSFSTDEPSRYAPTRQKCSGNWAKPAVVFLLLVAVAVTAVFSSKRTSRQGGTFSSIEQDGHTILYCYDGRNRELKWAIVFDRIVGPFVRAKGGISFRRTTGCLCHTDLTMNNGLRIVVAPSNDGKHLTVGNKTFEARSGQVFLYGWNSAGEPVIFQIYDRRPLKLTRDVHHKDLEAAIARYVAPIVRSRRKKAKRQAEQKLQNDGAKDGKREGKSP